MDESKQQQQSLDSLEEAEKTTSSADEDEEEEEEEELDEVDDDDDDDGDDGGGEFRVEQRKQLGESPKNEARVKSETLAVSSLKENDFKSNFAASAHLLSEVPVDYALLRPLESPNFKAAAIINTCQFYFAGLGVDQPEIDEHIEDEIHLEF
ncbi:hypothetical protein RHSIM_Rhsim01G0033700 [Rhododendron simsii]|uniref:Uncharacterized protein n=1 Tax=Rhododendron simsii TaxID=118357 RepID=A0A834HDN2_RHOSS|nr:hypothetical protein RHSIM_Rhsim01G0033700 [Rhododendron simsii]